MVPVCSSHYYSKVPDLVFVKVCMSCRFVGEARCARGTSPGSQALATSSWVHRPQKFEGFAKRFNIWKLRMSYIGHQLHLIQDIILMTREKGKKTQKSSKAIVEEDLFFENPSGNGWSQIWSHLHGVHSIIQLIFSIPYARRCMSISMPVLHEVTQILLTHSSIPVVHNMASRTRQAPGTRCATRQQAYQQGIFAEHTSVHDLSEDVAQVFPRNLHRCGALHTSYKYVHIV